MYWYWYPRRYNKMYVIWIAYVIFFWHVAIPQYDRNTYYMTNTHIIYTIDTSIVQFFFRTLRYGDWSCTFELCTEVPILYRRSLEMRVQQLLQILYLFYYDRVQVNFSFILISRLS